MMGTPHTRWREMHQSGRMAIMLVMRSSPQAGCHVTFFMAAKVLAAELFAIHADEPLFCRAENNRIVAAPAVRIAVFHLRLASQRSVLFQQLDDQRIDLPDRLANEFFRQYAAAPSARKMRPAASTGQ